MVSNVGPIDDLREKRNIFTPLEPQRKCAAPGVADEFRNHSEEAPEKFDFEIQRRH
jgi:hypothetical protein